MSSIVCFLSFFSVWCFFFFYLYSCLLFFKTFFCSNSSLSFFFCIESFSVSFILSFLLYFPIFVKLCKSDFLFVIHLLEVLVRENYCNWNTWAYIERVLSKIERLDCVVELPPLQVFDNTLESWLFIRKSSHFVSYFWLGFFLFCFFFVFHLPLRMIFLDF